MEKQDRMERFRIFLSNNGFYVVLVLCLVLVGGAVALLALTQNTDEQAQAPASNEPIVIVGQSNDERLNDAVNAPKVTPSPRVTPAPISTFAPLSTEQPLTPAPTAHTASTTTKAAPPVDGEVVFGYAVDKLLYSVTLDQWTTHAAVDIAADAGTPVKCVFSGTVERVEKDDALGYTVTVRHSNGRSTVYACLGEEVHVKAGDKLSAGDTVGTVGTSAISECALPAHVHFAVLIDGAPKDPAKYVRLG